MTVSQEFPLAGFLLSIPVASCPCRWIMSHIPQQVRWQLCASHSPISIAFFLRGCSSKLGLNSGHSSSCASSGALFQDWINHLSTEGHIPAANPAQPTLFQALGLGSCVPLPRNFCLHCLPLKHLFPSQAQANSQSLLFCASSPVFLERCLFYILFCISVEFCLYFYYWTKALWLCLAGYQSLVKKKKKKQIK